MCAPGEFSVTGEAPCTPAPVGTFVDTEGATEATDCPVGFYQDEVGQTFCEPAAPGTFVDITGAAAATLCPLGTFQPNSGATSCLLAPIGTYVDFKGAIAATNCPPGTTTEFTGATSVDDCIEPLLAVAYSNLDGINGYDPTGTDVLIAKLVDTSGDGLASAGDTVVTSQYPLDFGATGFGSFTVASHGVTAVSIGSSDDVVIEAGAGSFVWRKAPAYAYEQFTENGVVNLGDFLNSTGNDLLLATANLGVSQPDTTVAVTQVSPTDDPFIDVDIFV